MGGRSPGPHGLQALEATRRGPIHCPGTLNSTTQPLEAVELLLLAALALLWAITTVVRLLVVPLVAVLIAALTPRRRPAPGSSLEEAPAAARGLVHEDNSLRCSHRSLQPSAAPPTITPLAALAADLMALPAAELRRLAGTRSKLPKTELTARICAMPI